MTRSRAKRAMTVGQLNALVLVVFLGLWLGYELAAATLRWIMFFVIAGIIAVGLTIVIYGTIKRNRWGLSFNRPTCPCCQTPAPTTRGPRSVRQALWGGWTCSKCGTEVDKWGREISQRPERETASRG